MAKKKVVLYRDWQRREEKDLNPVPFYHLLPEEMEIANKRVPKIYPVTGTFFMGFPKSVKQEIKRLKEEKLFDYFVLQSDEFSQNLLIGIIGELSGGDYYAIAKWGSTHANLFRPR